MRRAIAQIWRSKLISVINFTHQRLWQRVYPVASMGTSDFDKSKAREGKCRSQAPQCAFATITRAGAARAGPHSPTHTKKNDLLHKNLTPRRIALRDRFSSVPRHQSHALMRTYFRRSFFSLQFVAGLLCLRRWLQLPASHFIVEFIEI